ncbi:hypothetical protein QBK99_21150 [Corticibacterium sp. UT-5YL-CI-8]|nr:hypothetical protein [Tianweitania sp. UT-5YL-CI-8]
MQAFTRFQADGVVDQYVGARAKWQMPLSTADAVRTIRLVIPEAVIPDHDLVEMIAKYAIERNLNIHFDHGATAISIGQQ